MPADWKHPEDSEGCPIPLHYAEGLEQEIADWHAHDKLWAAGQHPAQLDPSPSTRELVADCDTYTEWHGAPPDPADHMPDWPAAERTHYQMYETTTEGTPMSPVFATPEDLARWLVENNASSFGRMTASYEAWLAVCNGGYAPSAVLHLGDDGSGGTMQSGVQAMHEHRRREG